MSQRPPDSALVVVDMQRIFAEPSSPWAVPGFDTLIDPVDRLTGAFGDRVVFTRFLIPEAPTGSWADYYERWPFARLPAAIPLLELVEPWAGTSRQRVDKPTFSKWGLELEHLAGEAGALVLCGVTTECCVLATALGAVDAGVTVRVVEDACAGTDRDLHMRTVEILRRFEPQVLVTSTAEELAALGSNV